MTRIAVVAGVALDRAWPDLGTALGEALREHSRSALAQVVQETSIRDTSAIVVLGGLVSRATVVPDTLAYAAAVFESFPGTVHVAPGPDDWWGGDGPYEIAAWPDNVHFWTSPAFEPAPDEPRLWGSACTTPTPSTPRFPRDEVGGPARVLARAGLSAADLDRLPANDLALTVPELVAAPGEAGGSFVIVDVSQASVIEVVHLSGRPGRTVDLVVDEFETTADLAAAFADASAERDLIVIRLSGVLAPRVLLPGTGGPDLMRGQVLQVDALTYAVQTPEPTDRSTRAEFLRAMAASRGDDRQRHQTTALGLAALDASTGA